MVEMKLICSLFRNGTARIIYLILSLFLMRLIAVLRPDVVVLVGLDAGARAVRLETTARNLAEARVPDNAGLRHV